MENQANDFHNVFWTDEITVQLENHRHFSHRKCGEKPRPKPRYMYLYVCIVVCIPVYTNIKGMLDVFMYIHALCLPTAPVAVLFCYRPKHPVKACIQIMEASLPVDRAFLS